MKYRTFQPQFHASIRAGIKASTIRGKAWAKVGERVALCYWTGVPYRSPMGILGTAVVTLVEDILIDEDGPAFPDGVTCATELAEQEGFCSWADMLAWFDKTYGLPYTGVLTRWEPATLELVDEAKP